MGSKSFSKRSEKRGLVLFSLLPCEHGQCAKRVFDRCLACFGEGFKLAQDVIGIQPLRLSPDDREGIIDLKAASPALLDAADRQAPKHRAGSAK